MGFFGPTKKDGSFDMRHSDNAGGWVGKFSKGIDMISDIHFLLSSNSEAKATGKSLKSTKTSIKTDIKTLGRGLKRAFKVIRNFTINGALSSLRSTLSSTFKDGKNIAKSAAKASLGEIETAHGKIKRGATRIVRRVKSVVKDRKNQKVMLAMTLIILLFLLVKMLIRSR